MKKIKNFIKFYKNNKEEIDSWVLLSIVIFFAVIGAYSMATYIIKLIF